jgi:DNA-binding GntR family transcriptional regulator
MADSLSPTTPTSVDALTLPGTRSELIVGAIRRAILSGRFVAGSPLTEAVLANELGTSKTPVREALKMLSITGLVVGSQFRGMSVRAVDKETLLSVGDLRLLLEPEAVRRTIKAGIERDVLRHAVDQMTVAVESGDASERSSANRAFHRVLYAGCGNSELVRVLDDLTDVSSLIAVTAWASTDSWRTEAGEHRALAKAALAGDAEGTASRIHDHIVGFQDRALAALSAWVTGAHAEGS